MRSFAMNWNNVRLALLFTILSVSQAFSQEMLGLTTGNYSGINGTLLNPASMINSKMYIDMNVMGAGAFFESNWLYIKSEDFSFHKLLNGDGHFYDPYYVPSSKDTYIIYDDYPKTSDKNGFGNARLLGPGFMWNHDNFAFAVSTQARSVVSFVNMPYHVAKFIYEGVDFPPLQDSIFSSKDFRYAQMSWGEIDFSLAYRIWHSGNDNLSIGVTAKWLKGYSGVSLLVDDIDYMVPDDSTLVVYNMNANMGLSLPVRADTFEYDNGPNLFRGRGLGFDLGICYQHSSGIAKKSKGSKTTLCGQQFEDYDFRIGLALLDFGRIHFTQQAYNFVWQDAATNWPGIDYTDYNSINEAWHDISYRFTSDSSRLRRGNEFTMFLPTAVSVQFDYHVAENFYVHSLFMQNLRLEKTTIRRPGQLAVVPRYDTRYLGIALPVSLYDMQKLRLGLSARLLFLTVGTDKLGTWVSQSDFTGLDLYFALKIPLNKGYCKKKRQESRCPNGEYRNYLRPF